MKSSSQDKVQGPFHASKSRGKETVGKITDSPKPEAKGKGEKVAAKRSKKSAS